MNFTKTHHLDLLQPRKLDQQPILRTWSNRVTFPKPHQSAFKAGVNLVQTSETHAWRPPGHCLCPDKRSPCATQATSACPPQPDPAHQHHGFAGRTRGPRTLTRQHPQKTPLAIHLVSFTLFPFHSNHGSQDSALRKLQPTLVASMHSVNGMNANLGLALRHHLDAHKCTT